MLDFRYFESHVDFASSNNCCRGRGEGGGGLSPHYSRKEAAACITGYVSEETYVRSVVRLVIQSLLPCIVNNAVQCGRAGSFEFHHAMVYVVTVYP